MWGSLLGLLVFIIIYFLRKDLRSRMLIAGVGVAIAGVFSEAIFFQDYWNPPLLLQFGKMGGIEDVFFGFAAGGLGVALYDVVFHKRFRKKGHPHHWIIPCVLLSELIAIGVFFYGFGINSIYASMIGFIVPALVILIIRPDLFLEIFFSAIFAGAFLIFLETMFLFLAPQYLESYFFLHGKTVLVFGIAPLTELLWGVSFGAIIGPLYDFKDGTIPVPISNK